jgi:hypothetical protein
MYAYIRPGVLFKGWVFRWEGNFVQSQLLAHRSPGHVHAGIEKLKWCVAQAQAGASESGGRVNISATKGPYFNTRAPLLVECGSS